MAGYRNSSPFSFREKYPKALLLPSGCTWLNTPPTWVWLASAVTMKGCCMSAFTRKGARVRRVFSSSNVSWHRSFHLNVSSSRGRLVRGRYFGELGNMFTVKPARTEKAAYFFYVGGRLRAFYCLNIWWTRATAFFRNDVSEEFYLFLAKRTFTKIWFDTVTRETLKAEIESLSECQNLVPTQLHRLVNFQSTPA